LGSHQRRQGVSVRPGRWRWAAPLVLAGLAACVSSWPGFEKTGYYRTETPSAAGNPVGAELCADCHDSFAEHAMNSQQHAYCEACHGAGERHAYTTLAEDIRFPASEDCIACHGDGHTVVSGWELSEHARAGLLCSSCHDTHGRELQLLRRPGPMEGVTLPRAGASSQLCASCHSEVTAHLQLPSHHPVAEGMLDCSDCHSPHQSGRETLGARTDTCAQCHQEVMGPWIYEHPPVAEDCMHCHTPHGASADDLLEPNQPAACISCHTLPTSGAVHDPFAFTTRCTDCHGAVHGSYTDPHLRR
jgi:DmsE family decaheme c-type cytochrome